jgi:6-pyruvoyl-tetrahydropterin synthase
MIELTGTATAEFSAGHVIEFHPRCGRPHGHRWRVAVTIKAGQDPKTGELLGLPELATAVEQLAAELDRESVNDMLPGVQPTPAGVALAFRERLSLNWHSITEVAVAMDNVAVTVHA